jgi:hypothetical protein
MATIKINGKDYIVPAMNLKQLRNGGMALIKASDEATKNVVEGDVESAYASLEPRAKLIHMALTADYPELTEDDVFSALNLANVVPYWLIVLGNMGIDPNRKASGEGQNMGEAQSADTTLTT